MFCLLFLCLLLPNLPLPSCLPCLLSLLPLFAPSFLAIFLLPLFLLFFLSVLLILCELADLSFTTFYTDSCSDFIRFAHFFADCRFLWRRFASALDKRTGSSFTFVPYARCVAAESNCACRTSAPLFDLSKSRCTTAFRLACFSNWES